MTEHRRRAPLPTPALRRLGATLAVALLAGCGDGASNISPTHVVAPDAGCEARVTDLLHFGLNTPQGPLPEREWQRFLAEEITPRFPDGLTVLQAQGQWRNAAGIIEREPSRVVEIIHDGDLAARQAVREIVARYKTRYRQESVLRLSTRGLACF